MPLQTFDFGNLLASQKPDYSGLADLVKNYYAGEKGAVEAAFRPQGLQSEIAKRLADTRKTQLESDYYPRLTEADIAYKMAQAGKKEQPDRGTFGKAVEDYNQALETYGEKHPITEAAKQNYERVAQGSQGFNLEVDPETGAISFSAGGSGQKGQGGQLVTDGHGNKVWVTSAGRQALSQQQARSVAQSERKYFESAIQMPNKYKGTGATNNLYRDRKEFMKTKDPQLLEDLATALAMDKLTPDIASAQILASGGQMNIPARREQIKSLKRGWPVFDDAFFENMPMEVYILAEQKYQDILDGANSAASQHVAQGFPIEMSPKSKEKVEEKIEVKTSEREPLYKMGYSDSDIDTIQDTTKKSITEIIEFINSRRG